MRHWLGAAGALVMVSAPIQCTGIPSVQAQCQVYHHQAEVRIVNNGKAVAHLRNMLITLHNGRQQSDDLGHYALQEGGTVLETAALTGPAGGHHCTVQVNIT